MYVGFGSFNQKSKADNKGSSGAAVNYLSKENEGRPPSEHEHFFNHDSDRIWETQAQEHIDGHNKHIGKKEAKFYMFTINPSEREQKHLIQLSLNESRKGKNIKNVSELLPEEKERYQALLKNYTKNVMELYAANFNKNIKGKDLVYVAKVEHQRRYKSFHDEVKTNAGITKKIHALVVDRIRAEKAGDKRALRKVNKEIDRYKAHYETTDGKQLREDKSNLIKRDMPKEGLQTHVHIIVHRNTKDFVKISPNAKSRGHSQTGAQGKEVKIGFDHERFKEAAGKMFREQFNYRGSEKEQYTKPIHERAMASIERKASSLQRKGVAKVKGKVKSEIYSKVFHAEVMQMKSQANQVNALVRTLANLHKPHKILAQVLRQGSSHMKSAIRVR